MTTISIHVTHYVYTGLYSCAFGSFPGGKRVIFIGIYIYIYTHWNLIN